MGLCTLVVESDELAHRRFPSLVQLVPLRLKFVHQSRAMFVDGVRQVLFGSPDEGCAARAL
jgi:hypothetical protein